jgi:hypothetical protein
VLSLKHALVLSWFSCASFIRTKRCTDAEATALCTATDFLIKLLIQKSISNVRLPYCKPYLVVFRQRFHKISTASMTVMAPVAIKQEAIEAARAWSATRQSAHESAQSSFGCCRVRCQYCRMRIKSSFALCMSKLSIIYHSIHRKRRNPRLIRTWPGANA